MSGVEDLPTAPINEFQYKWNIENTSIFVASNETTLDSTKFTVPALDVSEFYLKLVKREDGTAQCFLCRTDKGPESLKISYSLSVGSFYTSDLRTLLKKSSTTKPGVVNLKEFVSKYEQGLGGDALLFECRLWQSEGDLSRSLNNPESPYPISCTTRTIFPKEERNLFVSLKNFGQMENGNTTKISPDFCTDAPVKLSISLEKFETQITILYTVDKRDGVASPFVLRSRICLVDALKERHVLSDNGYDLTSEQLEAKHLLVPNSMMEKKDLYVPNDELLLLFELAVSESKPVSFVENTRYDTSDVCTDDRECGWAVYLNHFGNRHRFLFQLLAVLVLVLAFLPHLFTNNTL